MLLKYLLARTGMTNLNELKCSDIWEDVLVCMALDNALCNMFSICDWQEALVYFKNEQLSSDDPSDYLKRLLA